MRIIYSAKEVEALYEVYVAASIAAKKECINCPKEWMVSQDADLLPSGEWVVLMPEEAMIDMCGLAARNVRMIMRAVKAAVAAMELISSMAEDLGKEFGEILSKHGLLKVKKP